MPETPQKPRVTLFFPVYRDEGTVRRVCEKSLKVLADVASEYEVIIVDDGSPDRSGEIADDLARQHEEVHVVHHEKNLGYGEAMKSGFARARHEWICVTDGDDQSEKGAAADEPKDEEEKEDSAEDKTDEDSPAEEDDGKDA